MAKEAEKYCVFCEPSSKQAIDAGCGWIISNDNLVTAQVQ
tara:strand:+ start:105 stop:224 length:120 start_codon:yes stop_codon:yes gene_type:complete